MTQHDPPAYAEHSITELRAVPAGVERAKSPLRVVTSNTRIQQDWSVILTSQPALEPDVFLKTTNAKIITSIYLEGREKGQTTVEAETTNASIQLSVSPAHGLSPQIRCTSTNAPIHLRLHDTFYGTLVMRTTNSRTELSTALARRAIRIRNAVDDDDSWTTYEIGGKGGLDTARARTTNAKIGCGLISDL